MAMPHLNIEPLKSQLTAEEFAAVSMITTSGYTYLKMFIPPVTRTSMLTSRKARYIWRWVAFNVSPHIDDWNTPSSVLWINIFSEAEMKRLDEIVTMVINLVPKSKWFGAKHHSKLEALHGKK